jgi:hypothetical protein
MIFQHTYKQVLDGTKTQTRRLVKPGEELINPGFGATVLQEADNMTGYRNKWTVGRTYAVQPGRGKEAIGRIRITAIRREHIQDISITDIKAEGLEVPHSIMPYGAETNDFWLNFGRDVFKASFGDLWNRVHYRPGTLYLDNPEVWVLEFELVEAQL